MRTQHYLGVRATQSIVIVSFACSVTLSLGPAMNQLFWLEALSSLNVLAGYAAGRSRN